MESGNNQLVVIGIGNPDRADDGVGPRVVARLGPLSGARVHTLPRDAFAIIEAWAGAAAVILIDAAAVIAMPGRVHRIDLAVDQLPCELGLASTHAFGLAEAISLARSLGRLPAKVIVYAIEGVCFEPGAPMSAEVIAAVDQVSQLIAAEVRTTARTGHDRGNQHAVA
jgi:hydrogenase maturation protease